MEAFLFQSCYLEFAEHWLYFDSYMLLNSLQKFVIQTGKPLDLIHFDTFFKFLLYFHISDKNKCREEL